MTVVDLDTGLRSDVLFAPAMKGGSALDLQCFGVDPRDQRLLFVGTGLDASRWEPYEVRGARVPRPSVLAYELQRLPFASRSELRAALAGSGAAVSASAAKAFVDQGPQQGMLGAAALGHVEGLTALLDRGADPSAALDARDQGHGLAELLQRRGAR